jgi:hypothetical protein
MLAAVLFAGCGLLRASVTPTLPPAQAAWATASVKAAAEVQAGRYGVADLVLADFTAQYPRTTEAAAANYWRALYKADPANQSASARDATILLDSTLALPLDSAQRANAQTLRRITAAMQRAAALNASASSSTNADGSSNARPDANSRDDEVQRLRAELAKANAELERIKKRVAQPKPD